MPEFTRLFSQQFWTSQFIAYGPACLKMRKTAVRAVASILDNIEIWPFAKARFGEDAKNWMRVCHTRLTKESENQLLWMWFYYRTAAAVEVETCEQLWFENQKDWRSGDIAVWKDRNAAVAAMDVAYISVASNSDLNSDTVTDPTIPPSSMPFKQLFAALWHVQASLSREATYLQNIAARFITLDDRAARDRLFALHAARIRVRVTGLFRAVLSDIDGLLDGLETLDTDTPTIANWLATAPDIKRIMQTEVPALRSGLQTNLEHFTAVRDVFAADAAQRQLDVDNLDAINSGSRQAVANRLKRIAIRQYTELAVNDPRKRVADEWDSILRNGDLLKNPVPGSAQAQVNQNLRSRVQGINAGVAAQAAALSVSHPDPRANRQIPGPGFLGP